MLKDLKWVYSLYTIYEIVCNCQKGGEEGRDGNGVRWGDSLGSR